MYTNHRGMEWKYFSNSSNYHAFQIIRVPIIEGWLYQIPMHCFRITFKRHHFVVFLIVLLQNLIGIQLLLPIFYNLQPSWTCDDEISGTDPLSNRNCTILSNCPEANLTFRAPFHSMVWDLRMLCGQQKYFASLISTFLYAGVLVGAISFGQLSDAFGRKKVVLFILVSVTIFGSSCALVQSWIVLGVMRFVVGALIGGLMTVVFAYAMELILPEQRLFLRGMQYCPPMVKNLTYNVPGGSAHRPRGAASPKE